MTVFAIAENAVRLLLRDRANIFFVFIFPLLLVLLLGAAFGGATTAELVVAGAGDGPFSSRIVQELQANGAISVVTTDSSEEARTRVARGRAVGALLLPDGLDASLGGGDAPAAQPAYVAGPDAGARLLQVTVEAALRQVDARLVAAAVAADATGVDRGTALARAEAIAGGVGGPRVTVTTAGVEDELFAEYADAGVHSVLTHQQVLLFTFLTSLTAATALIQSRRLGVARRMLAAPTTVGRIVVGETLGRFAVALVQAVYIVVGTGLLFGVRWGAPLGWVPLLALFALVSSGAGMLLGATFSNEEQTGGLGVLFGLALGALGGCMLPLELFSPTMQTVAHFTPHAWALDGFREVVGGGSLGDVGTELLALGGFAITLLAAATVALRRSLLRAT